jgi:nickel-type superoxide dismutase maturation protease
LPTLRPGDYLMVNRLAYVISAPREGDVVGVKGPAGAPARQIKRVANVPGGEVYVLGDNPPASTDSRDYGPVSRSRVEGRAWLRYWPPSRFGRIR